MSGWVRFLFASEFVRLVSGYGRRGFGVGWSVLFVVGFGFVAVSVFLLVRGSIREAYRYFRGRGRLRYILFLGWRGCVFVFDTLYRGFYGEVGFLGGVGSRGYRSVYLLLVFI